MGKKADIPPTKVAQMAILREEGLTQVAIGERLGVSQSVVQRCLARYAETGSYAARPRPSRKRVTSHRTDKMMKRIVVSDPTASSSFVASELPSQVSSRTVRRRLQLDFNLRSYRPAAKPNLSKKNIADRLAFAKRYLHWTAQEWHDVMFSDETIIKQFYSFSTNVRRPVGQRYNPRYTVPRVKHSPSVMIWGSISATGRGALWFMPQGATVNARVYLSILEEKVERFMVMRHCRIFQHDGAPCHTAKIVRDWLVKKNIAVLQPWPGSSPDLNPIENCWAIAKKKIAQHKPTSHANMIEAIKQVWTQEITPQYCAALIDSMPQRLQAVVDAKGRATKY